MRRTHRTGPTALLAAATTLALLLLAPGAASPCRAGVDAALGYERMEGTFLSDDEREIEQLFLLGEFGGASSRFTVRLPYLRLSRTGNVIPGPDGPIVVGAGGPGRPPWQESDAGDDASGPGDLYLRSESLLLQAGAGNRPSLAMVVDLKWPTADEGDGLGTGEYDYGMGFDYTQPLGRVMQILGAAAYQFVGSPDGVDFEDRLRLSAGFGFVTRRTNWRLLAESITPVLDEVPLFDAAGVPIGIVEVEDYRVARGEMVFRGGNGGSVRLYVLTGLNDSSPDLGFGLVLSSRPL